MGDLNKAMVIGRLGSDPKTFGEVVKFTVATTRKTKDKDETDWFNVTAFKNGGMAGKFRTVKNKSPK